MRAFGIVFGREAAVSVTNQQIACKPSNIFARMAVIRQTDFFSLPQNCLEKLFTSDIKLL